MKKITRDFSGGIVDNKNIYGYPDKYSETCDNLFITKNLGLRTRFGRKISDSDYPRITGSSRISKIVPYSNDFLMRTGEKLYDFTPGSGFSEIQGDNGVAFNATSDDEFVDHDVLNNQIIMTSEDRNFFPIIVYDSSGYQLSTASLPEMPSTPSVALSGSGSSLSYGYKFCFKRKYTVTGSGEIVQYGETTTVIEIADADASAISALNPASVTSIPELQNVGGEQHKIGTDGDDIKIAIFRTRNAGTVFYEVGEVDNGVTFFSDTKEDDDLSDPLYAQGGTLDNSAVAKCKYVTVAKDSAWFANSSDHPQRIWQSKALVPGAVPESNYIDVDEPITALGNTRNFPIAFTINKVYRIEGYLDAEGRGILQKRVITDRVGCINFRTIAQTRNGIYYAGTDGFYFTDGYSNTKISEQIDDTYLDLITSDEKQYRMNAIYDPTEQKVYFSVMEGSDNDKIFVFDERYNAWTTMTGTTGFVPVSMASKDNTLYMGDDEGYFYEFDRDISTDCVRDTSAAVTAWGEEAIVYKFKHIAEAFGNFDIKKWVYKVSLQVRDTTGQHISVESYDEDDLASTSLKPITSTGLLTWGESGFAWGATGLTWLRSYVVNRTRRFVRGTLRTYFKQLYLTNQTDAIIQYSDQSGTAIVDATAKTIHIGSLSTAITCANNMKDTVNAHFNDYGAGTEEHKALQTNISTVDATDLTSLIALVSAIQDAYVAHNTDAINVSPTYHQATGTTQALTSAVNPSTLSGCLDVLYDIYTKFNDHIEDSSAHTDGDSSSISWSGGIWNDKGFNYYIKLDNSDNGYNDEFYIASRDSGVKITVTDSSGYLNDSSSASWEIFGTRKGEILDLHAISYSYGDLSDAGSYYQSGEQGGNS